MKWPCACGLCRGRRRYTWSLFWSTTMLQPVLQSGHTLGVDFSHQTRCWYRKSLLHNAPTGQMSTTLPASLLLHGWPGKMSISSWLPRWITCSSAVPLISRVKRTQRVHITQRSVNRTIWSPM